jgi:hypothetical protein
MAKSTFDRYSMMALIVGNPEADDIPAPRKGTMGRTLHCFLIKFIAS